MRGMKTRMATEATEIHGKKYFTAEKQRAQRKILIENLDVVNPRSNVNYLNQHAKFTAC